MKKFLILLTLLIFASSAIAFTQRDVFVSNSIYLFGEPKEIQITINNNSIQEKELELGFIGPNALEFEFLNVPKTIPSKGSVDVVMKLKPLPIIENTAYKSTILISLGVEQVRKEVNIVFVEQKKTPVQKNKETIESTGLVGFFTLANPSLELVLNGVLFLIVIILLVLLIVKLTERRA